MKRISLVGQTFGKLTVIADADNDARGNTQSLVQCECGEVRVVSNRNLKNGTTRSCGCLQKEVASHIAKTWATTRWNGHVKKERVKSNKPVGRPMVQFTDEAWARIKEMRIHGYSLRWMQFRLKLEGLATVGYVTIYNYLPLIDEELENEGWRKTQINREKVLWQKDGTKNMPL